MCNSSLIDSIKSFNYYYMPFIIIIGLTGNVLSVTVFMSSKLKRIPSSHCLTAMALVDCGVLLLNSFNLLGGINLLRFNGWCQITQYVSYVLYFLSVWFVVSFTVERFVVVYFPLRRMHGVTVTRCRIIIVCMVIASCLWNVYIVCITQPVEYPWLNETVCTTPDEFFDVMLILNYVDTAVTFVLPFLLIVVLNSLISFTLIKNSDVSNSKVISPAASMRTSSSSRRQFVSTDSCRHAKKSFQRKDEKITKVLLLVSFVFLLMNLPDHTVRLIMAALHQSGAWGKLSLRTACSFLQAQQITNIIFNTNFAVNFFLYNLAGKNFRRHLKELLRRLTPCFTWNKRNLKESLSITTTSVQRENLTDQSMLISSSL